MATRRWILLGLVATLLQVAPARAALWMEFEPRRAYPGTLVKGRTIGDGALLYDSGKTLPAYLRAVASNDLIPIGRVRVDGRGNGTLAFRVPNVSGGWYSVVMSCPLCTVFSSAGDKPVVGKLRVLGPKQEAADEGLAGDSQGFPVDVMLVVGACLLLVSFVLRRAHVSSVARQR
jgi:hypothetical protein